MNKISSRSQSGAKTQTIHEFRALQSKHGGDRVASIKLLSYDVSR